MKRKMFPLLIILVLLVNAAVGCAPLIIGTAVGVSGYVWFNGAVMDKFDVSLEKVRRATLKGFDDLGIVVKEERSSKGQTKIIANDATKMTIKIHIRAITDTSSRIRIRYGLIGDQIKSEMILNIIRGYL